MIRKIVGTSFVFVSMGFTGIAYFASKPEPPVQIILLPLTFSCLGVGLFLSSIGEALYEWGS